MLQLKQTKSRLNFVHFAIYARSNHRGFTRKAKVFQVINALFRAFIVVNNGATSKVLNTFVAWKLSTERSP
jgi:hypothetical protein